MGIFPTRVQDTLYMRDKGKLFFSEYKGKEAVVSTPSESISLEIHCDCVLN